MKQYTTPEQTVKLIELGFKKPPKKGLLFQNNIGNCHTDLMLAEENYSIGELIGMLPKTIGDGWYKLEIKVYLEKWKVLYIDITNDSPRYYIAEDDLIDAIFNMIIKLKEAKVL